MKYSKCRHGSIIIDDPAKDCQLCGQENEKLDCIISLLKDIKSELKQNETDNN